MREEFLQRRLQERSLEHAFRSLRQPSGLEDFCSNDYLGIVRNQLIEKNLREETFLHGSAGSRLLAGNYPLIEETESKIARFHKAPATLIYNSGYDANFGLLACIARKGDLILYDKLSHASIRDGVRQSFADSHSFMHNDPDDLEKKLKNRKGNCFVVTESVFSMDGDIAPLRDMTTLCDMYEANLIVDEAHATGVIGENGEGVVQDAGLENHCFARIVTFGKALGCHGAAIVGCSALRDYLVNFSRPFIYSTAMPPAGVAAINTAYDIFPDMKAERNQLRVLAGLFDQQGFKKSETPIQCFVLPGNERVKQAASALEEHQLDVRPILYPTVPLGEERLRIALHSFNEEVNVKDLISILQKFRT